MSKPVNIKISDKLLTYQKAAVRRAYKFMCSNGTCSCYNASEMGTGKTIMAIETLNVLIRRHKLRKTLIVCPACVEYNWKNELEKWLCFPARISILDSGKKYVESVIDSSDVVITSYGMIRSGKMERAKALARGNFDNIIYDESHSLKNSSAKQTKAAFYLWESVKTRQALSGTPFLSNIVDGYSLFHRMSPKHFPDFKSFVEEYSYKTVTPWAIKYFGVKNPEKLKKIIRSNFYLRCTLEDCETELPPVNWIRVSLPDKYSVNRDIEAELQRYHDDLKKIFQLGPDALDVTVPNIPALAEHRRLQAEKAVPPILEFATNILEQDMHLVIFGWHKSVLNIYKEKLSKYNPGLITGETSLEIRDAYVKDFQSGRKKLLIVNYIAGGVGITLTAGHTAICAELDWNPTVLAQAAGRLRRIGQKKIVNIYYFPTIKSIDERVIAVVQSKMTAFNKVM